MELKKIKLEVLRVHNHKITEPTGKYKAYKTRIDGDKHIVRASEKDFFMALHEYYYGPKITAPSLKEAISQWIETREKSGAITYQTALHYRDDAEKFIFPDKIASKNITQISKAEIISFLEGLVGDGSKILKKTLSNIKTVINGGFDYAGMLDGVDCIDARRISIRDLKKRCYENDNSGEVYLREEAERIVLHVLALLEKKEDVYLYAILLFFCLSIRIGEIRALKWSNIDLDNMLIHLDHQMVTKKEGNVNRKTICVNYMKGHSSAGIRDLEISEFAAYVLFRLRKLTGDKEYVLQSRGVNPIYTNTFNDKLKEVCEALGIRYRSSHKIRFYAASNMYEHNIPEWFIQTRMGHKNIEMTRKYNRGNCPRLDDKTVNELFGFPLPEPQGEKIPQ